MAKPDYYKLLDLPKTATEAEIKKAYRRLAMKFHRDSNPDDPAAEHKFKECKEAYEVLTNAQKRAVYDQFGHAGSRAVAAGVSARAKPSATFSGKCSATSSQAASAGDRRYFAARI